MSFLTWKQGEINPTFIHADTPQKFWELNILYKDGKIGILNVAGTTIEDAAYRALGLSTIEQVGYLLVETYPDEI